MRDDETCGDVAKLDFTPLGRFEGSRLGQFQKKGSKSVLPTNKNGVKNYVSD